MRKLQYQLSPILVAALLFSGGCKTLTGNDPVVVDAEKSTSIAFETINTFLKLEYDNQAIIKQQAPAVHTYANYVRIHSPQWISTARALTNAYKSNRTPANKANLQTALAVLTQAISQIGQYTTKITTLTGQ